MAEVVERWPGIDVDLRFVWFGLECAIDVSFDAAECERVFREAAEDQISAKRTTFFTSLRLVAAGHVAFVGNA